MKKAFTLIELLVVVAIMGILGTVSVGGYQAMERGMTERGVMQNVDQFMLMAYQRAQIDRAPVEVYFWNELYRAETENDLPIVVGKAVAVRQSGRITSVSNNYLYDEFGDLRFSALTYGGEEDDEEEQASSKDDGMYLYQLGKGNSFTRSVINQSTVKRKSSERLLLGGTAQIESYAFVLRDRNGVTWKEADPYGFEFAELQLPHNYIFGSAVPTSIDAPVKEIQKSRFFPARIQIGSGASGGSGDTGRTIRLSSLRPDGSYKQIGTSTDPTQRH